MKKAVVYILLVAALLFGAFLPATAAGPKEADPKTREMNSRLPPTLSADDREESEFSIRGLIAAEPLVDIRGKEGKPVWDTKRYGFLEAESPNPDTVPAALWRHARRNAVHGLFKVTDGIYQVRGYDISNISFIEGKTGYIVVDPLMSVETARAALELLYRHLPRQTGGGGDLYPQPCRPLGRREGQSSPPRTSPPGRSGSSPPQGWSRRWSAKTCWREMPWRAAPPTCSAASCRRGPKARWMRG